MTIRVYLMPVIEAERGNATRRIPKYLSLVDGTKSTFIRYGQEDVGLFIDNSSDAASAAISANSDVRTFPVDLDTVVTNGPRTQIVNALEALNVPAHWVANGQTFRVVFRRLAGVFQLLQNVQGRGLRFLQASLDSPISGLPANVRQAMQDGAAALNLSTTGITGATTLRVALASIGAQFDARPVRACGTEL